MMAVDITVNGYWLKVKDENEKEVDIRLSTSFVFIKN